MKAAQFVYRRPGSVEEAIDCLIDGGPGAKVLAGGQSLLPMMNLRLARPDVLVDIGGIPELSFVQDDHDGLRVGAMTTHHRIEVMRPPEEFGLLPAVASLIGHFSVRTRGTIGGSLVHADPTSEWCLVARLLDATMNVVGPHGRRAITADTFFTGYFSTALSEGEILTDIALPRPQGASAVQEHAPRHGDFATVSAGASVAVANGQCVHARIVIGGVADRVVRAHDAEQVLLGAVLDEDRERGQAIRAAADVCATNVSPADDIRGSASYRKRLTVTLVSRALSQAIADARLSEGSER